MIVYGILIGVAVAAARVDDDDDDDGGRIRQHRYLVSGDFNALIGMLAVVVILIVACIALDIVCIVKRARRTLTPSFFLTISIIQTVFWTVLFVLSLLGGGSAFGFIAGIIV